MANHKSAIKRIRSTEKRRLRNKYYHKTTRSAIKKLRGIESKEEAMTYLPKVVAMIDKMVKRNIFHKNKAANIKSGLAKKVNAL